MKAKWLLVMVLGLFLSVFSQVKNDFYIKPLSIEEYVHLDKQIKEFDRLAKEKKFKEISKLGDAVIRRFPFIEMGYFFKYYGGVLIKDLNAVKNGLEGMSNKYFFSQNVYQYIYAVTKEIKDNKFKGKLKDALNNFAQKRKAFLEEKLLNKVNLRNIYKELAWVNYQAADEAGFLKYLDKIMEFDYGFIYQFQNRKEWKKNRLKNFSQDRYQNRFKWGNTREEKMKALLIMSNHMYYENASLHFAPIIDWNQHVADYLPRIFATQTKKEFYEILSEIVGKVGENHTNIQFPSDIWREHSGCGIEFTYGSNRFIVKKVYKKELEKTIRPGDIILSIDGIPIHDYIEKNRNKFPFVSYYYFKSKSFKMLQFSRFLLFGKKDSKVRAEFKNPLGKVYLLELVRDSYKLKRKRSENKEKWVELKIFEGNIWFFKIERFYRGDIYQQFLDLIKNKKTDQAKGLIFDIRDNPGGNSIYGDRIFSHLINKTVKRYAHGYHPVRIPLEEFHGYGYVSLRNGGYSLEPSDKQKFTCPVIVLISPKTGSAAEDFADLFQHNKRGHLVGLPTGGGTGNGHQVYLPGGGSVRVCLNVDLGFSWVGLQPDYTVDFTPEDIAVGRDPQLEKAIELLQNK